MHFLDCPKHEALRKSAQSIVGSPPFAVVRNALCAEPISSVTMQTWAKSLRQLTHLVADWLYPKPQQRGDNPISRHIGPSDAQAPVPSHAPLRIQIPNLPEIPQIARI